MTVQAREFSQAEREQLAQQGKAMPDGSYPIVTREDLENAIQAIGRSRNPEAARRHIKKRAAALGLEELIPEEWGGPADSMDDAGENRVEDGGVSQEMANDFTPRRPKAVARKGDWYRIENKADGSEVFIYDEIGGFGITSGTFVNELRALPEGDLTIHLNSPGGDVFDGMAIYQSLKNRTGNTTLVIDGLAASIASVIAMGADRVIMAPKAQVMIHDGFTAVMGNAAEMRKTADLLDRISDNIASVYADKAGNSPDFWRERMREETWYSAEEALEAGLVDEIEGQAQKREGFDLSMYNHSGRDEAPAPVTKEPTPVVEAKVDETPVTPAPEEEVVEFVWDFAAFQSALKGGLK